MTTHAYWLQAPGPEFMSGVELHYVCDDERTPDDQPFWTPSVDWWPSRIRYYAGEQGFHGMTEKLVHAKFENMIIHSSILEAVLAWNKENA